MLPGIRASVGFLRYRGLMDKPATSAVAAINTYYQSVMSHTLPSSGTFLSTKATRSVAYTNSSGRYQNNFIREWAPPAVANNDVNSTDINTILFISMSNDTDLVYPSSAFVNNTAITLTNWFANSTFRAADHVDGRTMEVSYYYHYDTFDSIRYVSATFDGPGTGANEFAGGTIIVLPGKWQPNSTISMSPSNTYTQVSMSNSEIGLYFGSHEQDTNMVDATLSNGAIQIGYNSGNWYGGQSVGLMYSNTGNARVDVVDNNQSSSKDRCIIAKLEWSPT